MNSGQPLPAAIMPSLGHLTTEDFLHVYEPQEDTWLFVDSLLAQSKVLRQLNPSLVVEIGCVCRGVRVGLLQCKQLHRTP